MMEYSNDKHAEHNSSVLLTNRTSSLHRNKYGSLSSRNTTSSLRIRPRNKHPRVLALASLLVAPVNINEVLRMIPDPVSWRHKVKYQLRWMLDKKSDICDTTEELAHEEAPTDEEVIQITEQTKVRVYLRAFLRLLVIIFKFMPAVVTYPMTFLGKEREDQCCTVATIDISLGQWNGRLPLALSKRDWRASCPMKYYSSLANRLPIEVHGIENCGPVFIKFGQWIGARCDLFPQACFRMLRLQDRAITHPWEETEQTLRVVFGDKWRDIFEEFEEQPIGSGCVAQVYRARVNNSFLPTRFRHECRRWEIFPDDMPSYTDVAIKVLHPKVKYYFMIDVLLLRIISKGLERFYPWSKDIIPESSINTFETLMAKQTDLRVEADNTERFIANFRQDRTVHFPTPIRPWVRDKVLVETFENAMPVGRFQESSTDIEKRTVVQLIYDTLLKMILVDNFVHGDLHGGNILIRRKPRRNDRRAAKLSNIPELESWVEMTTPEDASSSPWVHDIVILDSGIVTSFKEEVKESFKACFRTLLTNNGYEFAEIIMDHSKETLSEEAKLTFKEDMADFIDECWHTIEAGGSVMGPMLVQLFERLRFHQIFMDNDFSAIIMSFIIAEGMGRSLHPGPDILSRARPFIHRPGAETATRVTRKYIRSLTFDPRKTTFQLNNS